jgi:hypothetical protein
MATVPPVWQLGEIVVLLLNQLTTSITEEVAVPTVLLQTIRDIRKPADSTSPDGPDFIVVDFPSGWRKTTG